MVMTRLTKPYRRMLLRTVLILAFIASLVHFYVTPSLDTLVIVLSVLGTLLTEIAISIL